MTIGKNSNDPIKFPSQTRAGTRIQVSATSNGNVTLLSPAATEYGRILRWSLVTTGACVLKFTDETADLSGVYTLGGPAFWSGDEESFYKSSNVGDDLRLNIASLAAGATVSGTVWVEAWGSDA